MAPRSAPPPTAPRPAAPRPAARAPAASCLAALLLVACADGGPSGDGPAGEPTDDPAVTAPDGANGDAIDPVVAREARAAELLAPRETLPLVGTRWQVEAVRLPGPGKLPLVSGLVHAIEFEPGAKRARGHDGCGAYERDVRIEGTTIELGPVRATPSSDAVAAPDVAAGACGTSSEIAELERSVVAGLFATAARLDVRGDRLRLESPDGAALVLRGQRLDLLPAGTGPGIEPEFRPGERVPFAVLERSDGENLGARAVEVPERFVAVHDERGFEALLRNARSFDPAAPPVPDVDFDLGTALGAFSPLRATRGHAIRIDAVFAGAGGPEDGARVRVVTELPGPGCPVDPVPTVPWEIVVVPTVLANPRFEETVLEGKPCDGTGASAAATG